MFVGFEAILLLCPVWLYLTGLQVWQYIVSKIIFCYHITALSDSCTKKDTFLQQTCHRMILQIVETGFPANSDTSTQHTCCQLPVYVFRRSQSCVHCVLFHLITEQLLSRSVLHLESWYIWLDRRGTGGWGVRGGSQKQQHPSLGVCPPITTAGEGAGPTNKWDGAVVPIRNTIILPYIGQDQMYISEEAGKLTTLDRLKKKIGWPRAGSAASNLSCFVDVNPICSARGASRFTGGVTNWYIAPLPGTFSLFERFIQISVILILLNYKHNLQKIPIHCDGV